jgi:hypothetical protein
MIRKIERFVLLPCLAATTLVAHDPAERAYLVPAFNSQHKDKPKVAGWAALRIEEKMGSRDRQPFLIKIGSPNSKAYRLCLERLYRQKIVDNLLATVSLIVLPQMVLPSKKA